MLAEDRGASTLEIRREGGKGYEPVRQLLFSSGHGSSEHGGTSCLPRASRGPGREPCRTVPQLAQNQCVLATQAGSVTAVAAVGMLQVINGDVNSCV